jgi:hypothetical protein
MYMRMFTKRRVSNFHWGMASWGTAMDRMKLFSLNMRLKLCGKISGNAS